MSSSHHILIEDFEIDVIVGIYPHERTHPQKVRISVGIETDFSRAIQTDAISDTIDYDAVAWTIRSVCVENEFYLLERLAEEIRTQILERFHAKSVSVTIEKPGIIAEARSVKIVI